MGGRSYDERALGLSVGIIEIKLSGRYPHLSELLTDFSDYMKLKRLVEDVGDVQYYFAIPSTEMGKYPAVWQTKLKKYAVFHVKGGTVDIRTPPIKDELKKWIDTAKAVREKFIEYLKEKEIQHNVLLTLFDD